MKTSLLKNDIGDKIDSLIKEAKIQKLDKNITMLGQRKKGLFDRFIGKEQYTESLINNLKAQKKLVNLGNEFGNHMGMRDLLEYAESNGMTPNIKKFLLGFQKCGFELSDEDNKKITELCERDDKSTNLKETSLVKKMSRKEYRKSANELEEETREINSQIERRQSNEYKFAESDGKLRLASGISNALRQLKKIDEEFSKKMHIEKSVSRESDEREE